MKITDADLQAVAKRRKKVSRSKGRITRTGADQGPLSFPQARLFFLSRYEPGQSAYNMPVAYRVRGRVDPAALRQALRYLIERQEVLRTSLEMDGNTPVQRIRSATEPLFREHDLSAVDPAQAESSLREELSRRVGEPFALSSGQLLRTDLFHLPTDESVVLLAMHHIVGDGWSIGILRQELSAAYASYLNNDSAPDLPPLPIRYLDFAAWQREQDESGAYDRHYRFWERRLLETSPAELLPDKSKQSGQNDRGDTVSLSLGETLAEQLEAFCREQGATKYMVGLAAFALTLSHFTGSDTVSVGTPIAGRGRWEIAPLIGFFVNTLVMRVEVDETRSFRELVQATRTVVLEAHEHQHVPFERLVERLRPSRQQGNPLFQVMFSFESAEAVVDQLEFGPLVASAEPLPHNTAKLDLSVAVSEAQGELSLVAEFATGVFEKASIERVCHHFSRVLGYMLQHCDEPLYQFNLIEARSPREGGESEARAGSRSWNLHDIVHRHAEVHPDGVAIDGAATLRYADLAEKVDDVASNLVREGMQPGEIIALLMGDRVQLIIAMLGVLRAGGAFLNLDPDFPQDRISFMLDNSDCRWLATDRGELDSLDAGIKILDSERLTTARGEPFTSPVEGRVGCVIYTSGSTGAPKGVLLGTNGYAHHANRMMDYWDLHSSDRVLQFNSPGFDVFIEEVLTAFAGGATLVVPPSRTVDVHEVVDFIEDQKVTILDLPTAYWHAIANQLNDETARKLDSVRIMTIGGEAASSAALGRWLEYCPGAEWINTYGPTEASVAVTAIKAEECPKNHLSPFGPPIGMPLSEARLYLLDEWLRDVPPGVPGQVYIAGTGLAYGYIGQSALTAERFVPDVHGSNGERMYATGDICVRDEKNRFSFIGRADRQFKLNGYRIEPGEVEQQLLDDPRIDNAVAWVASPKQGATNIYACAVSREDVQEEQLRSTLKKKLPAYMVPARILIVDSMPMSPTGKVDFSELQRMLSERKGPDTASTLENPLEIVIAALWEEQFLTSGIGRDSDFFDVGGHSMAAISFIARLEEIFRMEVPLNIVFQYPVLRELCTQLRELNGSSMDLDTQAGYLIEWNTDAEPEADSQ